MNETNIVSDLGTTLAQGLGNALNDGLGSAYEELNGAALVQDAQSALASILLLFVGIAALFYVGRWLYKAFKRGAA